VVVVTGAGRGIGRGIAEAAAGAGAAVVVADRGVGIEGSGDGSLGPAVEVAEAIEARGGSAVAIGADVAEEAGADGIVAAAIERFGRIDAMVCCAGILSHARIEEIELADWQATIDVHLTGQFLCTRAAARAMLAAGEGGRIVLFSSASALSGPEQQPHYTAAKAGVLGLTRSCSRSLRPDGISVNCVLPGASTRMTDKIWEEISTPTWADEEATVPGATMTMRSEDAVGTPRDPANVAPFVVYLLGDEAAAINGRAFAVVGYQVTLLEEPSYGETIRSDGPWDAADLAASVAAGMPALADPRENPPWPPP
jgi:NAD(P)-dependent dehydrogenase (short-subunit alcohol dehydrogenase family)